MMQSTRGVALIEVFLVLGIMISIMILGIRFYSQFRYQSGEQKLMGNVNQLFQAAEGFYYANCRRSLNVNASSQSSGKLDPLVTDTSGTVAKVLLGVTDDLITPGFIPTVQWLPTNSLVDNTQTPDQGYYVQFNRVLVSGADKPMNATACTGSNPSPSCNTTSGATLSSTANPPATQTRSVVWVVQVAVKLQSTLTSAQWIQIMNDLSADCVSDAAGSGVATCASAPTANGYLVWTRQPSAFNPNISSDYWMTKPYVTEFNMQYTNDSMGALSGVTNETKDPVTLNTWYNALNYLCGG